MLKIKRVMCGSRMLQWVWAAIFVVILIAASVCRADLEVRDPADNAPDPAAIDKLIAQLGDASFQQRQNASLQLNHLGLLARPALLTAAHHAADPEIRARAGELLCVLPWGQTDDPLIGGRWLDEYQSTYVSKRLAAVESISGDPRGRHILLRLLREEPSDDVRWFIAQKLMQSSSDGILAAIRQWNMDEDSGPTLALVGWAWQSVDPQKAENLLWQAVIAADAHPSDDHGEILIILNWLEARARLSDNGPRVIDCARREIWHSGKEQMVDVVAKLFVAYSQLGPQAGFDDDLKTFAPFFSDPQVLYAIGRVYQRQGEPLIAQAFYSSAAAQSIGDINAHFVVGRFLLQSQWTDLAEREYRATMNFPGDMGVLARFAAQINLSQCAEVAQDDAQAAALLADASETMKLLPANAKEDWPQKLPLEIPWRLMRAAQKNGNRPEMTRRVNELLAMQIPEGDAEPHGLDIYIDMVRTLKQLGRATEGATLFAPRYARLKDDLEKDPRAPEKMNNLAWLCARCGEHPQEAYELATEAVTLTPQGDHEFSANLDTAAEAAANLGKWEEAIHFETTALKLIPEDLFMQSQLAQFKAASTAK